MGIRFPDLQVLLPRTEEIARAGSVGQQQDFQQHALAQAALVRVERQRNRVRRSGESEKSDRTRRDRKKSGTKEVERRTGSHPQGKGDLLDVHA